MDGWVITLWKGPMVLEPAYDLKFVKTIFVIINLGLFSLDFFSSSVMGRAVLSSMTVGICSSGALLSSIIGWERKVRERTQQGTDRDRLDELGTHNATHTHSHTVTHSGGCSPKEGKDKQQAQSTS